MSVPPERGPIGFAEKLLALLQEGNFSATYKYAVLLGLMDLCLEQASISGAAPTVVTTRQLAEKVLELYWPHTVPFPAETAPVLRQNTVGQAEILSAIGKFRTAVTPTSGGNGDKRHFLAAAGHVENWFDRMTTSAAELTTIAQDCAWESHADRTASVARAVYLRLPEHAMLWSRKREFVPVDQALLTRVLGASDSV